MMKIEPLIDGKVRIDCMRCGAMYAVNDWREDKEFGSIAEEYYASNRVCPECAAREAERVTAELAAREREEAMRHLPEAIIAAGIKANYMFLPGAEPPVRFAAEWIWIHRRENLLISGATGSGKTTSACFVGLRRLMEGARVRYALLRELLSEWRDAKRSDRSYAEEAVLERLFALDLLIIDEMIGKARVTESGRELLFELLDAVASGECRAKVWLLGNFYRGSLQALCGDADADPMLRRIAENFTCVLLDRARGVVQPLEVWSRK